MPLRIALSYYVSVLYRVAGPGFVQHVLNRVDVCSVYDYLFVRCNSRVPCFCNFQTNWKLCFRLIRLRCWKERDRVASSYAWKCLCRSTMSPLALLYASVGRSCLISLRTLWRPFIHYVTSLIFLHGVNVKQIILFLYVFFSILI